MELYICTTVRHLLLSIMKATNTPNIVANIVFFYDYQNAEPDSYDTSSLPQNIKIHFLKRRELTKKINSVVSGKITFFAAMREIKSNGWLKNNLLKFLKKYNTDLYQELNGRPLEEMYLFNERSKVSRLFRLFSSEYSIIEDGEANYKTFRTKTIQRPIRIIRGLKVNESSWGESNNCRFINVFNPERVPVGVVDKAKSIGFINKKSKSIIRDFFRISKSNQSNKTIIVATQPIETIPGSSRAVKELIYDTLLSKLNLKQNSIWLKIHPREPQGDYLDIISKYNINLMESKLPVEALLLGGDGEEKPYIISLNSTSGLGFEEYCNIIKIFEGTLEVEIKKFNQNNFSSIEKKLKDI
ncbi:polysialyltransferase family glycosyltransferase [uncultured Ferrimonas sp.]|uniref:polysialyltransferase family glycosyltransferase n=1 Tax=uncultured Ferrimonas sp. TaxID=432640 RepID=UPI00262C4E71|nr:polysialyltransferase family glycosyltransferase [uncultured Ferrimonas sp.]